MLPTRRGSRSGSRSRSDSVSSSVVNGARGLKSRIDDLVAKVESNHRVQAAEAWVSRRRENAAKAIGKAGSEVAYAADLAKDVVESAAIRTEDAIRAQYRKARGITTPEAERSWRLDEDDRESEAYEVHSSGAALQRNIVSEPNPEHDLEVEPEITADVGAPAPKGVLIMKSRPNRSASTVEGGTKSVRRVSFVDVEANVVDDARSRISLD